MLVEKLMSEKFRNKFRVATTRLNGYDYSRKGAYFITICTKKHINYLGKITVETGLRPVSTIININQFQYLKESYSIPDSCQVENPSNQSNTSIVKLTDEGKVIFRCWFDLTNHYSNIILDEFVIMPNHIHGIIIIKNHSSKTPTHGLSEFVRAFKSFSSRRINEFRNSQETDIWQPRFYDNIIRSDNELERIRTYIRNNPINWLNDELYNNSYNRWRQVSDLSLQ